MSLLFHQLLFIIKIAYKYWKTPSMAATGLSSTFKEPKDRITVPPILCFIFFNTNLPKSLLVPSNYFTSISGIPIFSSLTAGMRIKYSKLNLLYLLSDRERIAIYFKRTRLC